MSSGQLLKVAFGAIFLVCAPLASLAEKPTLDMFRTQKAGSETPVETLEPCKIQKSQQVDFTDAKVPDTLTISVTGGPCSEAGVVLSVTQADGREVYRYTGALIDHLPELIYEPQLAKLMSYYVNKALHSAFLRSTRDLPTYAEVSQYCEMTGDFVVVGEKHFDELRQEDLPILWHKTGHSTWVHVVFDPVTGVSEVIMRGGAI
ncbi:hypothetical protein KOI40_03550 [Aestuariicella sp. G3-2]|uniref:hypothetical protein n=1 Tax=Pseudomaricurvus albidus TaxID=2842452 RepID=UPI001C0C317F|nr:hypothetical protein [Aestuariicella albida]MBU3068879.1 hypothetical protein [Aestuariicella albida]